MWFFSDSARVDLFFGALPAPANDGNGFRFIGLDLASGPDRTVWFEAPMPDSVEPSKTTGAGHEPPE